MYLIFCSDPLNPRKPDPDFLEEVQAATDLGLACFFVNFELLINGESAEQAVQRIPEQSREVIGIYRGWMLKPGDYARFYDALLKRGIRLINDPAAYKHAHYLPESYALIETYTPRSVWLPGTSGIDIDVIMNALTSFGSAPVIVKDYVKSQKYYWAEAFFIPSAANRDAVQKVISRFLELQGSDLNEGLVFREFVNFEPLGNHSKSGMPVIQEYRLFFLNGELLYTIEYWPDAEYGDRNLPVAHFQTIARTIHSSFFTMDIARRTDGAWLIMELGDGQVAGLPERTDIAAFYAVLKTGF